MTLVKCDFDRPEPGLAERVAGRVRMLREMLGAVVQDYVWRRTRRGYHLLLVIEQDWPPLVVVVVQAILGSDWSREIYNLVRAIQLEDAPTFWRDRANVLYRAKSRERGTTMLKQTDYGRGKRPAWKYEDLGKATHAVLTIREVDPKAAIPDDEAPDGVRTVLTLTFEEDEGEKTLYTSYRQVGHLIERLGEDEKKWPGKQVVVKRARVPYGKQEFPKVIVAPPEEWDDVLGRSAGRGGRRGGRARR